MWLLKRSSQEKLAEKSVKAFLSDDIEECLRLLGAQKGFLETHLACWLPKYSGRLNELNRPHELYPVAAACFNEFVVWDMQLIDELKEHLSGFRT